MNTRNTLHHAPKTSGNSLISVVCLLSCVLLAGGATAAEKAPVTAADKPVEGELDVFLGDSLFERQVLYGGEGQGQVRGPNITVAVDGTVLARGNGRLRRSTDGGATWGEPASVPSGTLIVDETTGDVLSVRIRDEKAKMSRSTDQGRTWNTEETVLKPNEVMKWLEWTGLRVRSDSQNSATDAPKYYMHTGASETGVTLWHGPNKGRLLNTATFRPYAKAHPSDRDRVDAIFSCAIYSDDGGKTWQVSGFFPEGYTEEAALAELSDGRVYYNSRSHHGFYDKAFARELTGEERLRRIAWSYDAGETWEDLEISPVLPDGGGYDRGYGMMGGLVRLPVAGRDILLFSNADTAGGEREKMTVWASFDGAQTWPIKRLVYGGPSAYSSLAAGRPDTPSEGYLYLLFEGVETHRYGGIQVARFTLTWILGGELTGDGEVPDWVAR
ncbi:MAG: sialidase family protein [Candidatus Hydrogenedentota bacterium]